MTIKRDMINPYKSKSVLLRLFILCLTLFWFFPAQADQDDQNPKPLRTRMSLECIQASNEPIKIVAKLRYRENKVYQSLTDVEITFKSETEEESIEIARIKTNENGESTLLVDNIDQVLLDQDSFYTITGYFEGIERYKASDRNILFKRANLEVNITSEDSIKTFTVNAFELNEEQTPIGDQDVFIMVPRLFGNLTVLNDFSDEDGQLEVEFPNDIPADLNDSLNIIILIPETDSYGTLQTQLSTNWGVQRKADEMVNGQLWSPDPPLWMLVTFIILMGLVWGHFFVIIYKLYLIRKEGLSL